MMPKAAPLLVPSAQVTIDYTNYRGERTRRVIQPNHIWFGETPWHRGKQWLLNAFDLERGDLRDFAMSDIHEWRPS